MDKLLAPLMGRVTVFLTEKFRRTEYVQLSIFWVPLSKSQFACRMQAFESLASDILAGQVLPLQVGGCSSEERGEVSVVIY